MAEAATGRSRIALPDRGLKVGNKLTRQKNPPIEKPKYRSDHHASKHSPKPTIKPLNHDLPGATCPLAALHFDLPKNVKPASLPCFVGSTSWTRNEPRRNRIGGRTLWEQVEEVLQGI
jgi:hypothetical protein